MRTIRYAVISGIAAIAIVSGQHAHAQTRGLGRLNGTITSEAGEPIAGVVVKLVAGSDSLEGKSDNSGKWAVSGVGKGKFTAEFSKDGFETKRINVVVEKEVMQSEPIKVALKKT
jgi:carboxypeptidase family protein